MSSSVSFFSSVGSTVLRAFSIGVGAIALVIVWVITLAVLVVRGYLTAAKKSLARLWKQATRKLSAYESGKYPALRSRGR